MKNKVIKLTEADLRNIIKKSVNKIINEGTTNTEYAKKWEALQKAIETYKILDAVYNYLNEDQIADFIDYMERYHDITFDEKYEEYFSN